MTIKITRRDFLNGVAISVGAGMLTPAQLLGQEAPSELSSAAPYYPPTLTGWSEGIVWVLAELD